ncbi:hypothetical protein [Microscilla marina]|uniref:Uncharacterized protein n=1 Tax=Microscilla marina ATCC 23134 TaxID=313606 RepID=A1ZLU2_MICM2|nr:hypothetical protein [Microscilla marina]EAY28846.1 hypothetical protein M23134_07944 [Microscilla marina ATCC 23134]
MTKNNPNNHSNCEASALQQLAETFGSLDEMKDLFDGILSRMMWAYQGSAQANYQLVGDYDFIYQLKQALTQDLKKLALKNPAPTYAQTPYYSKVTSPQCNPPKVSNAAQALQIAEAKGITDFRVTKLNNEYVLLTNWTQKEVTAYQNNTNQALWGSFSDEGVFMIRFLHLMTNTEGL